MKDLLKQWNELEPAVCRKMQSWAEEEVYKVGSHCGGFEKPNKLELRDVQGAVQEAIEEKGRLSWEVGLGGETIHWWYARILKDGQLLASCDAESSKSSAHALLESYLIYLKQEKDSES